MMIHEAKCKGFWLANVDIMPAPPFKVLGITGKVQSSLPFLGKKASFLLIGYSIKHSYICN
jgi:hypothetical protein